MSVIKESDDSLFCLLFGRAQMKMALTISLIVGTILNLINQGHLISTPEKINLVNIILTYCVPYCVATISSALSTIKHQKKLQLIEENKRICENSFLDYIASNLAELETTGTKQSSESLALFINQFEDLQQLISLDSIANKQDELKEAKALIAKGELINAIVIIKEIVTQFANENTVELNVHKKQVELLSVQRTSLIEAFKVL